MSDHKRPDTSATDVGPTARAGKFAGNGAHLSDATNPDQLYALAVRLQNADRWRLLQPTTAEIQGLARMVVLTTPVFERAVELVEASDAGDVAGTAAKLKALIDTARAQVETLEKRP